MRPLPLIAALVLCAGCGPSSDADGAADVPLETATAEGPAADATPVDDGLPADLAGLDLQANHASGSVLRVTGTRFEPDHIAVDLAFTNGTDHEQRLNDIGDDMVLRDDLGNRYNVSAPPNNGDVTVQEGQNISGEFVFLGRLHPDATQVTLVTNEGHGSDREGAYDPQMSISIPVAR